MLEFCVFVHNYHLVHLSIRCDHRRSFRYDKNGYLKAPATGIDSSGVNALLIAFFLKKKFGNSDPSDPFFFS